MESPANICTTGFFVSLIYFGHLTHNSLHCCDRKAWAAVHKASHYGSKQQ